MIAGIEHFRLDPDLASNPLDLQFMPYTHGLPATLAWVVATFFLARAWLRETGPALALALATGSHWLLDLVVHRPDLPLWGDSYKVGLALWEHPVAALLLELGFLAVAAFVLVRSSALPRARRRTAVGLAAGLVAAHLAFSFAPLPPAPIALVLAALLFWLVVAWLAHRVESSRVGAAQPPSMRGPVVPR